MVVVKDEEVDAFKVQRASVIYQSRARCPHIQPCCCTYATTCSFSRLTMICFLSLYKLAEIKDELASTYVNAHHDPA